MMDAGFKDYLKTLIVTCAGFVNYFWPYDGFKRFYQEKYNLKEKFNLKKKYNIKIFIIQIHLRFMGNRSRVKIVHCLVYVIT